MCGRRLAGLRARDDDDVAPVGVTTNRVASGSSSILTLRYTLLGHRRAPLGPRACGLNLCTQREQCRLITRPTHQLH
jgi:hypothetical protein